jgi:hypothetical protein
MNPLFFLSAMIFGTVFMAVLNRGSSVEISSSGISQRFFGLPLYLIEWDKIESVTYSDSFPGSRYKIKAKNSWITTIDLPIDDENFLVIKKALADQGLVLAKAQIKASN